MSRAFYILSILLLIACTASSQDTAIAIESQDAAAIVENQDSVERKLVPIVKKSSKALDTALEAYSQSRHASLASDEDDTPFLTGYYYASAKKNDISFAYLVQQLAKRKANIYLGESGSQHDGLYLPYFPANAKLALFFRNRSAGDGVIEYRLIKSDRSGDTSVPWKLANGYIIIPKLEGGQEYLLMVRYPNHVNDFSGYVINTQSIMSPVWRVLKNILPLILLLCIPLCIFLLWKFIRTRRRSRQYQLELKALFSQLNPHFLFNSLSSIQGLINNNEIEKANQYLSGFSGLLRTTLDKGGKETIPLTEELDNLENYIRFEKLRFNFQYQKDIEPLLPLDDIVIPPLLAQPIIENSVKHGLSGMEEKGSLILRVYSSGRDMFLSIKDNGKGFDITNYTPGYGIDLIQKRILLYNKWHRKSKIFLTMKSEPNNTVMILQFQKWLPK